MASLQLIISDPALNAAVLEQLKLSKLLAASDVQADDKTIDSNARVVVIDEASLDKKASKFLLAHEPKKTVLLLGAYESQELDDVITESFPKPFRLGHLLARLRHHLDVVPRLQGVAIAFGPFRLEEQHRQLVVIETGAIIRLTEKETALLGYLAQTDATVSRDELLAEIWGYDARIDTHTLETHIYQLRRKLDPDGKGLAWLVNEQGSYRLNRTT